MRQTACDLRACGVCVDAGVGETCGEWDICRFAGTPGGCAADTDALTGLPNRQACMRDIDRALAFRHAHGALLLIDLDMFRSINGSLGHDCGDCLLRAVAARLQACLSPGALLARFSGDEFAVVVRGATLDEAGVHAALLLECFDEPFAFRGLQLLQQASIGVALYPQHGESASELHSHADLALHRAKKLGRRTWQCYEITMGARVRRRQFLLGRLRRALLGTEFHLHYQPRVDLLSGAICGWEALLRWNCPGDGAVSPAEFIPVAEDSGLIVPIGEWALHEACRQFVSWRNQGLEPGSLAVNLSPRQLRAPQLVERVAAILEETGLPAAMLELEITETAVMEEFDNSAGILARLSDLGVGIAVDDFGTGYSSLAYLRRLPVDKLKIDRSFVRALEDGPQDVAIVRTIIELARTLGLTVVAEGVESETQWRLLQGARCHEMQGYLFSRPVSPASCARLMREGAALPPARLTRPPWAPPLRNDWVTEC